MDIVQRGFPDKITEILLIGAEKCMINKRKTGGCVEQNR